MVRVKVKSSLTGTLVARASNPAARPSPRGTGFEVLAITTTSAAPVWRACTRALKAVVSVNLPEPPRRLRSLPGGREKRQLAAAYQEEFEKLFVKFGVSRQEVEVRSTTIRNEYWGFSRKLTIGKDAFGNAKVWGRARARTHKRAKSATGKVPLGRPPRGSKRIDPSET